MILCYTSIIVITTCAILLLFSSFSLFLVSYRYWIICFRSSNNFVYKNHFRPIVKSMKKMKYTRFWETYIDLFWVHIPHKSTTSDIFLTGWIFLFSSAIEWATSQSVNLLIFCSTICDSDDVRIGIRILANKTLIAFRVLLIFTICY